MAPPDPACFVAEHYRGWIAQVARQAFSEVGLPITTLTPQNLSKVCLENTKFVDFFGNDCRVYYYNRSLCQNESAVRQMTPVANKTAHPGFVQGGATARSECCACKMEHVTENTLIFETAGDLQDYNMWSTADKCQIEIMFGHVDVCVGEFFGTPAADDAMTNAVTSRISTLEGRRQAHALSLPAGSSSGGGGSIAATKSHVAFTSDLLLEDVALVFRVPSPRGLLDELTHELRNLSLEDVAFPLTVLEPMVWVAQAALLLVAAILMCLFEPGAGASGSAAQNLQPPAAAAEASGEDGFRLRVEG